MKIYYSTFPSGLSEPAGSALLHAIPDTRIKEVLDGLIIYETEAKAVKIKQLPFFNNSFSLISKLNSRNDEPLESTIIRIIKSGDLAKRINLQSTDHRRTFRVVTSIENQLVSIDQRHLQLLEKEIKDKLELSLSRRQADYEFWLLRRSEGFTLFSLRLTKQSQKDKDREKGELKSQLSYLLCWLSDPKENEIFMDPFCGSGAIPLTRVTMSRKGLIIAGDCDAQNVEVLKERVKQLKLKDRIVVRLMDATNITKYSEGSISKIVTDPPWGMFEKMHGRKDFYNAMMKELVRVLKQDGILILVIANDPYLNEFFKNYNEGVELLASYNVLVSGKKAIVYQLQKI